MAVLHLTPSAQCCIIGCGVHGASMHPAYHVLQPTQEHSLQAYMHAVFKADTPVLLPVLSFMHNILGKMGLGSVCCCSCMAALRCTAREATGLGVLACRLPGQLL